MSAKNIIWVIGDSTLSSFDDKIYYPRYGYGTKIDKFVDDTFIVKNLALSGRSSKSFTQEPEYDQLIKEMKKVDFLIIGFGHNDEKTEEGRFTKPISDKNVEGSIAESLYNNYIKPAKEKGTTVILATPIVRRTVTGEWSLSDIHITSDSGDFKGGDYSKAIKEFGEKENIAVVDMTKITKKLYEQSGPEITKYFHAWTSYKDISVDNTHTNQWGAMINAYNIMNEIKKLRIPEISDHIVNLENDPLKNKEKYLVVNPDYIAVEFNSNLSQSKFFQDACGFKASVFGDIGNEPDSGNFIFEEKGTDSLRICVKNNSGKIAASTDGIAMYYKKVPADKNICLKAKMRINDYFLNNQVSFGLMVRDDIYIDIKTSDVLGDYVAAAPLLLTYGKDCLNCFARKNGKLINGGTCTRKYEPGDVVDVMIESTQDGYACTFGDEKTVTGGFDFKLTSIDSENVYVGMFVSRNADITFENISLTYK